MAPQPVKQVIDWENSGEAKLRQRQSLLPSLCPLSLLSVFLEISVRATVMIEIR